MNLSFKQLKAFVLIARLGNFTRAAEHLHITQAGLSVMMRELEAQLDNRLFDRTTRSVSLTSAGEKFVPAALAAIEQLESTAAQISDMGEKARQTLRVAATPLVSSNLLPAVCRQLRVRHPEVTVRLTDCDLGQVHALVENGEVDCGLGFFFQAARGVERTLLCSFQLMRVAPFDNDIEDEQAPDIWKDANGSWQANVGTVPWSTLKNEPLISLPPENPIQKLVETHLAKIGRDNEDRLVFNHFDTLIAMVAAGIGTAIIPTFAMRACQRHRVRTDLLLQPEVSLGFHRITKRGRAKPPAMLDFSETLVSLLPGLVTPIHT
jgi:DNA-binding transcriptional LysR family regulator